MVWEWLAENSWLFWLLAMAVLVGIEMLTLDFLFLMMAAAAFLAFVLALFGVGVVLQVVVFSLTSVLLIFLVRPIALRRLNRSAPGTASNVERLVGLPCQVLEPVDARHGLVLLEGDTWTARSLAGEQLPAGTDAVVHAVEGATAVVAPYPVPTAGTRPAPRPSS